MARAVVVGIPDSGGFIRLGGAVLVDHAAEPTYQRRSPRPRRGWTSSRRGVRRRDAQNAADRSSSGASLRSSWWSSLCRSWV